MKRRNREHADPIASDNIADDALKAARPDVAPLTNRDSERILANVLADLGATVHGQEKPDIGALTVRTVAALGLAAASLLVWHSASARKLPHAETTGLVVKSTTEPLPTVKLSITRLATHTASMLVAGNHRIWAAVPDKRLNMCNHAMLGWKRPICPQIGLISYFETASRACPSSTASGSVIQVRTEDEMLVCSSTTQECNDTVLTIGGDPAVIGLAPRNTFANTSNPFVNDSQRSLTGQILIGSAVNEASADGVKPQADSTFDIAAVCNKVETQRFAAL